MTTEITAVSDNWIKFCV